MLTIVFLCSRMYLVIFVRSNCAKGLNAVGLILLTLQILVCLFEHVVNTANFILFVTETWAGMLGYVLLIVLFVKNRLNEDFILTLIGVLLWVAQFFSVFVTSGKEHMVSFLYCSAGILGVGFILIGMVVYAGTQKVNKDK